MDINSEFRRFSRPFGQTLYARLAHERMVRFSRAMGVQLSPLLYVAIAEPHFTLVGVASRDFNVTFINGY